jgi:hypothetical protein
MTDRVKVASVSVVGSIVAAVITTFGTIFAGHTELKDQQSRVKSLQVDTAKLESNVANAQSYVPIGSVVASLLTKEQFAEAAGDPPAFDVKKSKWKLADGSSVAGSRYSQIFQIAAFPDLRGLFLRAKNESRSDGKGNPDGEKGLGEFEMDQLQDHEHEFNRGSAGDDSGYVMTGSKSTPASQANTNFIVANGAVHHGAETRPRNATVNYYVRVN